MKSMNKHRLTLYIAPNVYEKMYMLVDKCPDEIAWHGFIERIDDNTFFWYDIVMYPQYVSGTTTMSDEEEYAKWLMAAMDREDFGKMRLHGHSHVNMGTTPSGIDVEYRKNMLSKIKNPEDFYIFLITNKRRSVDLEIFDYKTQRILEKQDVDIILDSPECHEKNDTWADEMIKANIRKESTPCSTTSNPWNSSTRKWNAKPRYMSSDAEPLADPLLKSLLEQE